MTAEEPIRAQRSLRLLLESDREFGLDEVLLRAERAAFAEPPPDEMEHRMAPEPEPPRAPLREPRRGSSRPESSPPADAAREPQASAEGAAVSIPRRDRLPDVRTEVPRLARHDGDPERRRRMDALEEEIHACSACGLCQGRKTPVAGEGSVSADLMFVGEGPGGDEDRSGRPFVGAAGVLLSKIVHAMGFNRESVFIANAVKCRPPQNRTPVDTELSACRPFLERQIAIIQPRVICALGRPAAQALLQTTRGINALRGKVLPLSGPGFDNIVVVPTFHPAYLLRRPEDKGKTWSDVQIAAKQVLERGGSIPAQGALPPPSRPAEDADGDGS